MPYPFPEHFHRLLIPVYLLLYVPVAFTYVTLVSQVR